VTDIDEDEGNTPVVRLRKLDVRDGTSIGRR
jgi:hypothetical protein